MLFGALGRPRRMGVSHAVVRGQRFRLERTWTPHTGGRPAIEVRGRGHDDRLGVGDGHDRVALNKGPEVVELGADCIDQVTGRGVLCLHAGPHRRGVGRRVNSRGHLPELSLGTDQLAFGDGE